MNKPTKLLFVCSSNLDRSVAAQRLFLENKDIEAKSCGIFVHSDIVISRELMKWADAVFCMEHKHKAFIVKKFPEYSDKVSVLNISSDYLRNDPELQELLTSKLRERGYFV